MFQSQCGSLMNLVLGHIPALALITHRSWSVRDLLTLAGVACGSQSSEVSQPQHTYSMDHCSTLMMFLPLLGSSVGYNLSGMSLPFYGSPTAAVSQGCPCPGVVLPQAGVPQGCLCPDIGPPGMAVPQGFLLIHEVLPSRSASRVVSPTMPLSLASLVSFFHSPNLCRRRLPSLQSPATQTLPFVPSAIGKKEHEIPINYIYIYLCLRMLFCFVFIS